MDKGRKANWQQDDGDAIWDGKRQEANAFDGLLQAVDPAVQPHLELGAGVGVLVEDECLENVRTGGLAEVMESVYRAAQAARVPDSWLYGLVQKMKSQADVKRRRTIVDHAPGWNTWLEQFDDALTAAAQRELARVAHVKPLSPTERAKLLKVKQRLDRRTLFVGESDAILRLFERLDELIHLAKDKPITLLGEKGSGKTFLAELLHKSRHCDAEPFERCNAATFSGGDFNLAKGKLVGYGPEHGIRGIPPGQPGLLETCREGTILLDEFMDLPYEMQTLLLAVLDRQPLQKIGNGRLEPPYPDIVFTANKEPHEEIRNNRLRADMWDRLKGFAVRVPPLRTRREDVISWVRAKCAKPDNRALLALLRYDWLGNVRELENCVSHALGVAKCNRDRSATAGGRDLRFDCLPGEIAATVEKLSDEHAEAELLRFVVGMLRERGVEKGKGLNKAVAEMLGYSEGWASKKLRAHHII